MNKRQRKKQEKKQQEIILKDKARIDESIYSFKKQKIEVGDLVEIVDQSFGGYAIGTRCLAISRDSDNDFRVSKDMNMNDFNAMYHRESDLKLIKKGTEL